MALHSQTLKISKDGDPITRMCELYPQVNLAVLSCFLLQQRAARGEKSCPCVGTHSSSLVAV